MTARQPIVRVGTKLKELPVGDTLAGISATWLEKIANYTAVTGDKISADTTAGVFTITLPAAPVAGDNVAVKAGPAARTNNLTIARNGNTIMSLAQDMTVRTNNAEFTLVFDGVTWRL